MVQYSVTKVKRSTVEVYASRSMPMSARFSNLRRTLLAARGMLSIFTVPLMPTFL